MYILNFIRGFCMALADSVPGISGGTIAFLLGFYDDFINSLDNLVRGSMKERKKAIIFLGKLGIGWVIGMILAMLILASIFEHHIYQVSSLFMGFILLAIPIIVKEEKEQIVGHYKNILFAVIGVLIVAGITYFNPVSGGGSDVNLSSFNIGLAIYIFFAAMIAISAMVLPGISGSTLLLIFGLYVPIVSAVKEVLTFNFAYLPNICVFVMGVMVGIILIIRFIRIALEKFRSQTIYCIIGLMVGSLYAIVMGPTTLDTPKEPMDLGSFHIIYFLIGGIIVFGLQKVKDYFEAKKVNS